MSLNDKILEDNSHATRLMEHSKENQRVLRITCLSFFIYVVAEICGAYFGNSLSLLGDAAAMSVDVLSYFANMIAEQIKSKGGVMSEDTRFILEVGIPSFSIVALLCVTGWITSDAVKELMHPSQDKDDKVNISFLWGFSCANAVVDVISGYMFYHKRHHVFTDLVLPPSSEQSPLHPSLDKDGKEKQLSNTSHALSISFHDLEQEESKYLSSSAEAKISKFNINMASAFTHVGADSMRTAAVFIAAAVATATNIPGNICDAAADIIVTATILVAIMPLMRAIYRAYLTFYKRQEVAVI